MKIFYKRLRIKEGNARKIIIQNDKEETIIEFPVTVGVIGVVITPVLAAVGSLAAVVTDCTIIVEIKLMKQKIYNLVDKGAHGSKINLVFDYFIVTLIVFNVIAVAI